MFVQKQKSADLRSKLNRLTTSAAIVATPIVFAASAFAEDNEIQMGTLGLVGLAAGAATVFTIKSGPSLMMWGYRKLLGFIGR